MEVLNEKLGEKRKTKIDQFFFSRKNVENVEKKNTGGSRTRSPTVWPYQNGAAAASWPCAPGDESSVATTSIVASAL
jgi:hypothetical protein